MIFNPNLLEERQAETSISFITWKCHRMASREKKRFKKNPSSWEWERQDRLCVFLQPIYRTTQAQQNKTYETRSKRNIDAWMPGINVAFEMIIHSWKNTEEKKNDSMIASITNAANAEKFCPSPSVNHVCDLVPQAYDSLLRFGCNSSLILWKASVNALKTGHYTLSL